MAEGCEVLHNFIHTNLEHCLHKKKKKSVIKPNHALQLIINKDTNLSHCPFLNKDLNITAVSSGCPFVTLPQAKRQCGDLKVLLTFSI